MFFFDNEAEIILNAFHFFSKILTNRETHVQISKNVFNEIHISSFGLYSWTLGTYWSASSNRGQPVRFDGKPHGYYLVTVYFRGEDWLFCVFDSEFDKNSIKRSKRRVSHAEFILWQQFMVPRFRNHQKSGCVSSGCNFLICTRDLQFRIFITWCVYGYV